VRREEEEEENKPLLDSHTRSATGHGGSFPLSISNYYHINLVSLQFLSCPFKNNIMIMLLNRTGILDPCHLHQQILATKPVHVFWRQEAKETPKENNSGWPWRPMIEAISST
jgi:hypothetical protein